MNKDRAASEALIKRIEGQGFKAIMLTVDAAVPGKRELDQRAKGDDLKVSTTIILRSPVRAKELLNRICLRPLVHQKQVAVWASPMYVLLCPICVHRNNLLL